MNNLQKVRGRVKAKDLKQGKTYYRSGVGCSIREQEDHPEVCKTFMSDDSYSPTCKQDYNIIARST